MLEAACILSPSSSAVVAAASVVESDGDDDSKAEEEEEGVERMLWIRRLRRLLGPSGSPEILMVIRWD